MRQAPEHSGTLAELAAAIDRFVSPVFEPLGFDWRVNVGLPLLPMPGRSC